MKFTIQLSSKPATEPAEKPATEPAEKPAEKPAEEPAAKAVQGGITKTRRTYHASIPKHKTDALIQIHNLEDKIFCLTKALATLRLTIKETYHYAKEKDLVLEIEHLKRLKTTASCEFQKMCEVRRR